MWRNGRRNGLKIRWAVNGPCRFESGHRHSENVIFIGKFSRFGLNDGWEQSRMETHEPPVYLSSIRQVIYRGENGFLASIKTLRGGNAGQSGELIIEGQVFCAVFHCFAQ